MYQRLEEFLGAMPAEDRSVAAQREEIRYMIERFKTTGFGDPEAEERFQRAKSKKDSLEPAADNRGSVEPQPRSAKSGT